MTTWAVCVVVAAGVPLIGPYTSSGAPGEVRLSVASIEATVTGRMTLPLVVGLSGPLAFLAAVG
jgi:hypothetical protein